MEALVITNVCSISFKPDESFESADYVQDINTDFIKVEPKKEYQDQQDAEMAEKDMNISCPARRLHSQVPKVTLMRQTSHDLAIVSDLYSLLEDFMTMAHSSKSLLCCQPAGIQTVLMCEMCGDNFAGKADRMLKLCKHFQLAHPSDALKLILDAIKRYGKLIGHMRKALEFDKWFGEINYAPNLRNKNFECSKCQEKH